MVDRHILIGPSSADLGSRIASLANRPATLARVRAFPDGEACLSADLPDGLDEIVVVQGTHPPQDRHFVQLLQLVDIARARAARRIVAVVPYLAYARQDRRTAPGEALSALVVADALAAAGLDELVTVDVHEPRIFAGRALLVTDLTAHDLFADRLRREPPPRPVLVASDTGGGRRLEGLAQRLGWPLVVLDKIKAPDGATRYGPSAVAVAGRDAVVVDDLCSSGSTLEPLVRELEHRGAASIAIHLTHFLGDADALRARLGKGVDLCWTDTVPNPLARLSVAQTIVAHIEDAAPSTHLAAGAAADRRRARAQA